MADISKEQQAWKQAVYGEEVRDAEIALNDKMNAELEAGTAKIEEYGRKETERNVAEKSRETAESTRVTEEKKRAKAEEDRASDFSGIKTAAEATMGKANKAAENANSKATLADSKATLANNAAISANTAATNANNKATLADSKATLANTAATNANIAKDAANTAATNANNKATLADSKATLANTAADRANAAAKSAEDVVTGTGLIPTAQKGTANGVATLDTNVKIPYEQLGNANKTLVGLGNVPNVATNDQTPTYTQVPTRTNLSSGEKLSIAFGKIKKWFSDMRGAAFCDVANNQTTTEEGHVLDARQGKAISTTISDLSDRVDETNRNIDDVAKRPTTETDILSNALNIDTTNPYAPLNLKTWSLYSGSGTKQMPPGCELGVREFYYFNANWYVIKITEFHPMLGRTWYNKYDRVANTWSGWRSVSTVG